MEEDGGHPLKVEAAHLQRPDRIGKARRLWRLRDLLDRLHLRRHGGIEGRAEMLRPDPVEGRQAEAFPK